MGNGEPKGIGWGFGKNLNRGLEGFKISPSKALILENPKRGFNQKIFWFKANFGTPRP
ncbi:hypothetical protein LYNGBM3L_34950 [Moorena producens 3L]|uniref:Uncharacterized protein n=1 Tax=Moorena producens 3L TaxID=489825 RepID=F4XPI9_9CYAN|nr:hypothetical protein LYNGBM3L_34950 [Moorena producens 3L]